jgi:two-component system chemotaxis sensor kinase CheA
MDELTSVFIQEGREQLQAMEDGLLELEQNPTNLDNINTIFRAAHTVKGASGVIECHFIEGFMHKVENVLDRLRNTEIQVSSDLTGLLLRCCDQLSRLMDVLEAGQPDPDADTKAAGDALLVELTGYMAPSAAPSSAMIESEVEIHSSGGGVMITDAWHISVRFGPNVLRGGIASGMVSRPRISPSEAR